MNVYIVLDLHIWSENHTNIFTFKNCLFGATSAVRNSDKEKYAYCCYGIKFNSTDWWSFDNNTTRNVIISSSYNFHHHMLTIAKVKAQLSELIKVLVHQRKSLT